MQVAAIAALNGPQDCVAEINQTYRSRRDTLVNGLNRSGWPVEKPKATMFVWAPIPEQFHAMGSMEFAKYLIAEAKVAVSLARNARRLPFVKFVSDRRSDAARVQMPPR